MKILKRWERRTFLIGDLEIAVKLKCLRDKESPEFLEELNKLSGAALAKDELGNPDIAGYLRARKVGGSFVKDTFTKFVKDPVAVGAEGDEEVLDEDGKRIDTGAHLYEEASPGLVNAVLFALQELCTLGGPQGKGSASGSTSASPESKAPDSSSPATSTESPATPPPSTATAALPAASSSEPV